METITECHVCGSTEHQRLFRQRDLFHGLPGEFSVWQCQNCGLVFLNPRPTVDELADFYPASYVAYTKPLAEENSLRRTDRSYGLLKRLKFVKRFVKSGRILDLGCATGAFLTAIHQLEPQQWELYGVEPSPIAASIAQENSFAKISAGYLEEAYYPDHYFDVVTMWDVLEHVHDPTATLREVQRILKPQGVLIFSVPNLSSWDAAIFKQYWVGYDVPRHIHVFDTVTLTKLLQKVNFAIRGSACIAGSYFYFVSSIIFLLHAKFPTHTLTRFVERHHFALPIRLLAAPYFWVSDKMKKSTTLTIACRVSAS